MDTKSIAVLLIIFGCFAVLYPKIFHPIIRKVLGFGPEKKAQDTNDQVPPHLRRPAHTTGQHHRDHFAGDHPFRGQGPHPGMRAAAEMRKQAMEQQGSGRGGMVGMVLPVYAIGIVIYLVYTLCKIWNGRSGNNEEEDVMRQVYRNVQFDPDDKEFKYKYAPEHDADCGMQGMEDDEYKQYVQKKKMQKELDVLLNKADQRHITEYEMHQLQERLLETEAQMTRIMEAMKGVQSKMDPVVSGMTDQMGDKASPVDSSPDMDSFEILNKSETSTRSKLEESDEPCEDLERDSSDEDMSQEDNEGDMEAMEDSESSDTPRNIDTIETKDAEEEEGETEYYSTDHLQDTEQILGDKDVDDDVDLQVRRRVLNDPYKAED